MSEESPISESAATGPLPWHENAWRDLMARRQAGRLPHGLLITGPAGAGKSRFALALAQSQLCQSLAEDGTACGQCNACRQFLAGSHPDWRTMGIDAKRKNILIDQVRALSEWFSLTASGGHGKLALIEPADRMTTGAANSLLKTLEEPPGDSRLLLVSALPGRLTATVRSRCQQIAIPLPERSLALDWLSRKTGNSGDNEAALDLAGGSPLKALAVLDEGLLEQARENAVALMAVGTGRASLVATAEKWARQDLASLLAWWRVWLQNLARYVQSDGRYRSQLIDKQGEHLQKIASVVAPDALHELLLALQAAERRQDSANPQLLLESLLGHWARACGIIANPRAGRRSSREVTP